jgi:hypothetical protein
VIHGDPLVVTLKRWGSVSIQSLILQPISLLTPREMLRDHCILPRTKPATSGSDHFEGSFIMGSPPLPVELKDRIIDFCHDDQKTALTHSSWLPVCRFHLFHTISSSGEDGANRAVQLRSIASSGPVVGSQRWLSLLPYIKIVKIADALYLAHTVRCLCSSESLSPPSVHMRLSNLDLGPGVLSTSLSQIIDTVTHVQLLNVFFTRTDDIWKFLSPLSRLQHLELSEIGFYHSTGYSHPTREHLRAFLSRSYE